MAKRYAAVRQKDCVSCGACQAVCPKSAIAVWKGCFAKVDKELCIGCGLCAKACPANVITLLDREAAQA